MTPEDEVPPRHQKTVFRPSPLAAATGAAPPPGPNVSAPAAHAVFAQRAAPSALNDDVPPLASPMRVRNPVMAGAARMLALAAAIQAERQVADPAGLLVRASAEAKAFEKTLASLGLSSEDNARARYAVLATVDDIVQNLPGGVNSDWARQSLVVQSFGQAFGGDQFWTILDNMLARPAAYVELLELYHACLAVGFQGRLRVVENGHSQISAKMANIYSTLTDIRPRPENDLVPQWQGVATPAAKVGWMARALMMLAALCLLLLLIFFGFRFFLGIKDEPAILALQKLPPVSLAKIDRAGGDVAVPESGQLARIRARLSNPCIQALDDGASIRLVIAACPGLQPSMFDAGAAELSAEYIPLVEEAGKALQPEPGAISVVAHTDSDPIHGSLAVSYPDNLALSDARAANVQSVLQPVIGDPLRLAAEGRGDREPVDRGDTPEAKAKNRRVELVIARSE
jgi:type VI secretion system protein ImpK